MDLAKLNQLATDCAAVNPPDAKRSEIVFTEILCSEKDFGAGILANGKFAGVWFPGHVDVVESKEELIEILNKHENTLLEFGVNR